MEQDDDDNVPLKVVFPGPGSSSVKAKGNTRKGPVTRGKAKTISEKALKENHDKKVKRRRLKRTVVDDDELIKPAKVVHIEEEEDTSQTAEEVPLFGKESQREKQQNKKGDENLTKEIKRKRQEVTLSKEEGTSSRLQKIKGVKTPFADPNVEEKSEKLCSQKVLNGSV